MELTNPSPRKGESEKEYVSRFMGDAEAVRDYPDVKQRAAVAHNWWREKQNAVDDNEAERLWSAGDKGDQRKWLAWSGMNQDWAGYPYAKLSDITKRALKQLMSDDKHTPNNSICNSCGGAVKCRGEVGHYHHSVCSVCNLATYTNSSLSNSLSFCPHCGEDLRRLTQPAADMRSSMVEVPVGVKHRIVVRREVLRQEIEALWGLMPLPFGTRAIGVVMEEGSEVPVALACEGKDGMVELRMGVVKSLIGNLGAPETVTAPEPIGVTQPTVPVSSAYNTNEHKEVEGKQCYGGRVG